MIQITILIEKSEALTVTLSLITVLYGGLKVTWEINKYIKAKYIFKKRTKKFLISFF